RMSEEATKRPADQETARVWPPQPLDLSSTVFDDAPVGDARGADGLTGPATQAEVDVADLIFREGEPAALPLCHQVDAAPGRLRLQACEAECGAVVQTEAAVNAGGKVVVRRRVRSLKGLRRGFPLTLDKVPYVQCHGQVRYLPGERVRLGSNASRKLLIHRRVAGGVPHVPTCRLRSTGAASST